MSLATYSGLKTSIASYLNRDDLTAVIPDFISLAEVDFSRRLRTRDMLVRATATVDAQFTTLPNDFLEMRNLQLNTAKPYALRYLPPVALDEERIRMGSIAAAPTLYSIIGSTMEVAATPDTSYTAEMTYYRSIPALSTNNPTNWLLTQHPDLYLYTALMHSAPYLHDDDRAGLWSSAADRILNDIVNANDRAEHSGYAPLRARIKALS